MSDSESSETSSSSSEDEIAKPVYISKKQQESSATKSSREVLLSQLESKDTKVDTEEKYDVDDTDDLDPELEYNNWKLREKARFLHPYLPKPINGRPFVTLTYAQSLDSRIAAQPGVQTKLSHLETKTMTHYLRSKHDAILVGVGTVLADDPKLNCRYGDAKIRPVVIDPLGKWNYNESTLKKICDAGDGLPPYIFVDESVDKEEGVVKLPLLGGYNWDIIFDKLYELGIKSVMVEGGARVINNLLEKSVDSVIITVAPVCVSVDWCTR
ncbi:RIB7 [Candida metapsilosis]|uniref:2,5-diamino-6-ribosylamino-4(3H)-pyrimidinone 5'-phosphate reductase n=1 Tax=Candida metapsilosis TaxID=273372 RepID=A0A8H8DDD2_9ASCO|nr:RIB7 [Candida metapsilosis]